MKPAKRTVHPLALAAAVFVAVVLALTFTLGRQPPGPTVESAASGAEPVAAAQTAKAKPQTPDAQAKSDLTRRVINHAINATVFEGAPMLQ